MNTAIGIIYGLILSVLLVLFGLYLVIGFANYIDPGVGCDRNFKKAFKLENIISFK